MGSKNRIARDIVEQLPSAEYFVDLFCGGCAVTHAAMLSGKYKKFIINDIAPDMPRLFADAINGKYRNEKRWISREDFERLKDTDAYVRTCWSFGNNGKGYLWNDETAGAKLLACKMILSDDRNERWQAYTGFIKYLQDARRRLEERKANMERCRAEYGDIKKSVREELCRYLSESGKTRVDIDRILGTNGMARHYFSKSQWEFPTEEKYEKIRTACPNFPSYDYWGQSLERLERLQSLQRLESLESLERLQSLQRLESLESLERLQSMENLQNLQSMNNLQNLQSMNNLRRLQRLESLESNLQVFSSDYQSVEIPADSCVYCDIPYKGTAEYKDGGFDYPRFYNWLRTRDYPVWVSEYAMPDDFVSVWSRNKICKYGANNNRKTIEHLFVHKRFADNAVSGNLPLFERKDAVNE